MGTGWFYFCKVPQYLQHHQARLGQYFLKSFLPKETTATWHYQISNLKATLPHIYYMLCWKSHILGCVLLQPNVKVSIIQIKSKCNENSLYLSSWICSINNIYKQQHKMLNSCQQYNVTVSHYSRQYSTLVKFSRPTATTCIQLPMCTFAHSCLHHPTGAIPCEVNDINCTWQWNIR